MIPTSVEEALVNLYLTCQRAARTFNTCSARTTIPALRAAWRARSLHCRQVAGGLRPWLSRALARPTLRRAAADAALWRAVPAEADEAALLRAYEACEGYVLACYRDTIDLRLPDPLADALLPQFEAALTQYVEIVAMAGVRRPPRRAATETRPAARQISVPTPAATALTVPVTANVAATVAATASAMPAA